MATPSHATDLHSPWHHWPVSILAIAFYAFITLDYALSLYGLGFLVGLLPEEEGNMLETMGNWLQIIWAVMAFGGLLGAWLLFKRMSFSVWGLFIAFVCLAFLIIWLSLIHSPSMISVLGFQGVYLMIGTAAIAFLFYLYARWERAHATLQ